ncbi:hypothetical protein ACFQMA_01745 [Halosimplex aquaticum]|uniref:HTH marR-type domain-containing protein n=1 Tax=Halosimplex aquaticum TaxID=3026162 RepID=A0ABD5XVA6_9EURY|nr:hypothetical protein [Halosimplex aquaticum]
MIHRRILDVAASDPEASLAAIADEVSGASTDLVERVLDEYGDPGREADAGDQGDESGDETDAGSTEKDNGLTSDDADSTQGDNDLTSNDTGSMQGDTDSTHGGTESTQGDTDSVQGNAELVADGADSTPDNTGSTPDGTDPMGDDAGSVPGAADPTPGGSELVSSDAKPIPDDTGPTADDADPTPDEIPAASSLSEKQHRTLRALYERPDASQGDLAEDLDVTRATVCRRLNAIPGFEWSDRHAFAEAVFGDDADSPSDGGGDTTVGDAGLSSPGVESSGDGADGSGADRDDRSESEGTVEGERPSGLDDVRSTIATLDERVAVLETRVADDSDAAPGGSAERTASETRAGEPVGSLPPELTHKVIHACMESDRVTEDEELDVLRAFMQG